MDNVILAYIAGFFDGEGSIGSGTQAGKTRTAIWMSLRFSQNDRSSLEQIAADVEQLVGVTGPILASNPKHNKLSNNINYSLQYQLGKGYEVAKALLPYVRMKKNYLEWFIFTWENRWAEDGKTMNLEFFRQQHLIRPGRRKEKVDEV